MTEKVKCPVCGFVFSVEDAHRPFRCPKCGTLLDFAPPDWRPRTLIEFRDMMGGER